MYMTPQEAAHGLCLMMFWEGGWVVEEPKEEVVAEEKPKTRKKKAE